MSSKISLIERHTDATQRLILDTAIELLENRGVKELTVRSVAREAGISERTVFRYFASRDEFLDAVAGEAVSMMRTPEPPDSIEGLIKYPTALYQSFEESSRLIQAMLHSEIFGRVRVASAGERWKAVEKLVDNGAPRRSKKDRRIASTNINYYLGASTWH